MWTKASCIAIFLLPSHFCFTSALMTNLLLHVNADLYIVTSAPSPASPSHFIMLHLFLMSPVIDHFGAGDEGPGSVSAGI